MDIVGMRGKHRPPGTFTWGALLLLAGVGCGSSSPGTAAKDAGPPDADFAACVADNVPPYMAGAVTASKSGSLVATLASVMTVSAGAPPVDAPAVGLSTFTVTLADTVGGAPAGVTMTAEKPYMPRHMHAASITPVVTDQGGGTFVISQISFFMTGYFQLTLDLQIATTGADDGGVADDGGSPPATDHIVLAICVPS